MGRGLDLWGEQQVMYFFRLSTPSHHNNLRNSEIAEPQKLLPHLLQPNVSLLSSETIGIYIQAAVKLFGAWSMELSQNWDNGKIQDIREVVDMLISRLKNFTSHPDAEVQERVRRIGAFFKYHSMEYRCSRLPTQCSYLISFAPI
jgi:AP-3 complex subunit delta-1